MSAPEGLSEEEKWEWAKEQIALYGFPSRGRPKKGQHKLTWADLGFTRQRAHIMRLLSEIPDAEFEAFLNQRHTEAHASGKILRAERSLLVHFGKINVVSDDIFDDTDIGRLADAILKRAGPTLELLTPRQLRYLARSLRFKLRSMAAMREVREC